LSERLLTEDEVHRVIESASNSRDALIMKTLYYTGLRCSELCGLTWKDVRESENGKGASLTVIGKGSYLRTVNISSELWSELKQYRQTGDIPLFASRKGSGGLTRSQVHRIVRAAATKAGIKRHIFPHAFRHSHATHAIEHGAPLHLVQQTLGHANLSITGLYLHVKPNESSGQYLSQ
jgi:integrase/recombinase XerD